MSRRIAAPKTQKRLTNIACVRMQRCGSRFEIACYPNKVEEWRRGVCVPIRFLVSYFSSETDLDEVLQTPHIYANVSQGQFANKDDLDRAFGTQNVRKIALLILEKGEIQVSGEERKQNVDKLFKDVAQIIAEKCVNRQTKEAVTPSQIERAMKECHVSLAPNKPAKQQALAVIKTLIEKSTLPIERAKMRLELTIPTASYTPSCQESLKTLTANIESTTEKSGNSIIVCQIEPSSFREVDDLVKKEAGKTEVLAHYVKPNANQAL